MPGGSLAGCWAARSRVPRACRVLAPAPGALALIATQPPLSPQAMAMTSEDSHASWYAVGGRGQQREGGYLGDIRGLFTAP
jgi:hypothetical protein